MGLVDIDGSTIVHRSPTVAGTAAVSFVTDGGVQVTDNGIDVFVFDIDGEYEIAAPVVASPLVIVAGGNVVTSAAEE